MVNELNILVRQASAGSGICFRQGRTEERDGVANLCNYRFISGRLTGDFSDICRPKIQNHKLKQYPKGDLQSPMDALRDPLFALAK
jgi:hypothetical protein